MEEGNKDRWFQKVLPYSTIIIVLVSALAYLCAYIYEISFCNYFGIPRDLIVVNWTRFFVNIPLIAIVPFSLLLPIVGRKWQNSNLIMFVITFSFVGSLFLLWFYYGNNLSLILSMLIVVVLTVIFECLERKLKDENRLRLILISVIVLAVTIFMLWFYMQILVNQMSAWILLLLIPIVMSAFAGIVTSGLLSFNRKRGGLIKCSSVFLILHYSGKAELGAIPETFYRRSRIHLFQRLSAYKCLVIFIVSLSIFSFLWTYMEIGKGEAQGEIAYSVQSFSYNPSIANLSVEDLYERNQNAQNLSEQNLVVLRIYGDNAICAPWYFDNESEHYTISKEFVIYPLDSITLMPKDVGPLEKPK